MSCPSDVIVRGSARGRTCPRQWLHGADELVPPRLRRLHGASRYRCRPSSWRRTRRFGRRRPAPVAPPLHDLVAEEVAWLRARHPGRTGSVSPPAPCRRTPRGRHSQADAVERFKLELAGSTARCEARSWASSTATPCSRPARRLRSPRSARRGWSPPRPGRPVRGRNPHGGMSAPDRLAGLTEAVQEAGRTGSKVLIRRVWLGRARSGLIDDQPAVYDSYAAGASPSGEDQTIASDEPDDLAERSAATTRGVVAAEPTCGSSCPARHPSRGGSRSSGSGRPSRRRAED